MHIDKKGGKCPLFHFHHPMKTTFHFPPYLLYLSATYGLGMVFYTLFRLVLFSMGTHGYFENEPHAETLILQFFVMGFRFDTVVSCYFLLLPTLCMGIAHVIGFKNRLFYFSIHIYLNIVYVISFFLGIADIPYFHYFFSHLTIVALSWIDDVGFMAKMIIQEPQYAIFGLIFLIIAIGYIVLHYQIYKRSLRKKTPDIHSETTLHVISKIIILIATLSLVMVGMRGRLAGKSPIRIGTAYFSNNAYANQMGLNPTFTFLKSVLEYKNEQQIYLIDTQQALQNVKQYLGADSTAKDTGLIARQKYHTYPLRANVVLVIMESMSAEKTGFLGNTSFTPNLDSLSSLSLSFTHIYTAGIHTHNGIYSTLFSYPALLSKHSMKSSIIPFMNGLPSILLSKGYETFYFTTHDDQFDNVGGFLRANGFKHIISQTDYPSSEIKSTLGVPDHIQFSKAIDVLNQQPNDTPFFATLMTASDHAPYILPENIPFSPKSKKLAYQITEYADWAIGWFLSEARKQTWFENTIFVFVADHGAFIGKSPYSVALSYHHSPLLIYSPKYIDAKTVYTLGLQIDVFPTLMGILRESYTNTSFGIDLINDATRRFISFSSDDKLCVMDTQFLYIHDGKGNEFLHRYLHNDKENYIASEKSLADSMKIYGFSILQTAQWLLKEKCK